MIKDLITICPQCGSLDYTEASLARHDALCCNKCEYVGTDKEFEKYIIMPSYKPTQIVLITENHGDAHIEWDTRDLNEVKILLESALSFINNKIKEESAIKN